jgi:hypothetical protein
MFSENLESFLMFFDLKSKLGNKTHLFTDNLVQFFVLIVGVRREVLIEVILCNCVNNVVCHDEIL